MSPFFFSILSLLLILYPMKIGVLSDTHGHLSPEIFHFFKNVNHIIHAGDIGDHNIIEKLKTVSPVSAIYGNIDRYPVTSMYKNKLFVKLAGKKIFIIHEIGNIKRISYQLFKNDIKPDIVIYGHTHKPKVDTYRNILYLNPGSASKPRPGKFSTVVILTIEDDTIDHQFIEIK
jgi:putative phosphoesterase